MSYALIEASDALGEPIHLYRFAFGGGVANKFAYTDGDFEIQVDADLFEPLYIDRNEITASETLDKSQVEVRVPENSGIAEVFLLQPPADTVALTIFRCHWDEDLQAITPPQTVWVGRVLSCSREGFEAVLSCEPVLTSLRRVGLRRHYQYMCPHVLYGAQCRANAGLHMALSEAVAVDPRSITVPGDPGEQLVGGVIAWQPVGKSTERRTILRREFDPLLVTTRFIVSTGVRDLAVGNAVELYDGCRHTLDDCRNVFDNAPNFGGMAFIPTENPHGTTVIYN